MIDVRTVSVLASYTTPDMEAPAQVHVKQVLSVVVSFEHTLQSATQALQYIVLQHHIHVHAITHNRK